MRSPRIYFPAALETGKVIELDERNRRHVLQVLRLQAGSPLEVFDGRSVCFFAVIENADKRHASIRIGIENPSSTESPLEILLAQGISRGERMDFTIQKSVELGVHTIQPLWTERTQVQLSGKRLQKRMDHWRGIAISACEQCGRNRIPEILAPEKLEYWINHRASNQLSVYLDPHAEQSFDSLDSGGRGITLLAGPEGGLAPGERTLLKQSDWTGIRLGPRVFRTETAALAAITVAQWRWGDLG